MPDSSSYSPLQQKREIVPSSSIVGEDAERPSAAHLVAELAERYGDLDTVPLLRVLATQEFPGRIAAVSSFGAESAVLLALVAEADPKIPVIFLETGKHFEETRRYRDRLIESLGLEDVRLVLPEARHIASQDPAGTLWQSDPDACCGLRKVAPLRRALAGWSAWITGRKRYQGDQRSVLPTFEAADGQVKINPLAEWSRAQIEEAFVQRNLPRHPLEAEGYLSIGCAPCTRPVAADEDLRAGRWAGCGKTECGIHWPS